MHSLMGDRFLKKFVGGILRRRRFIPTDVTRAGPDEGEEMPSRSGGAENKEAQGKEESENIEKTDGITPVAHPEGGLDRSSGGDQPPDGPQKAA